MSWNYLSKDYSDFFKPSSALRVKSVELDGSAELPSGLKMRTAPTINNANTYALTYNESTGEIQRSISGGGGGGDSIINSTYATPDEGGISLITTDLLDPTTRILAALFTSGNIQIEQFDDGLGSYYLNFTVPFQTFNINNSSASVGSTGSYLSDSNYIAAMLGRKRIRFTPFGSADSFSVTATRYSGLNRYVVNGTSGDGDYQTLNAVPYASDLLITINPGTYTLSADINLSAYSNITFEGKDTSNTTLRLTNDIISLLGNTYNIGTLSTTLNSKVITGVGTVWTTMNPYISQLYLALNKAVYKVASIDSDTQITLATEVKYTSSLQQYVLTNLNAGFTFRGLTIVKESDSGIIYFGNCRNVTFEDCVFTVASGYSGTTTLLQFESVLNVNIVSCEYTSPNNTSLTTFVRTTNVLNFNVDDCVIGYTNSDTFVDIGGVGITGSSYKISGSEFAGNGGTNSIISSNNIFSTFDISGCNFTNGYYAFNGIAATLSYSACSFDRCYYVANMTTSTVSPVFFYFSGNNVRNTTEGIVLTNVSFNISSNNFYTTSGYYVRCLLGTGSNAPEGSINSNYFGPLTNIQQALQINLTGNGASVNGNYFESAGINFIAGTRIFFIANRFTTTLAASYSDTSSGLLDKSNSYSDTYSTGA